MNISRIVLILTIAAAAITIVLFLANFFDYNIPEYSDLENEI